MLTNYANRPVNERSQATLERVVRAMVKERRAAKERLTKAQTRDFTRLIRDSDDAQAMMYVPARRVAKLESALKAAESSLKHANEVIAELKGETPA